MPRRYASATQEEGRRALLRGPSYREGRARHASTFTDTRRASTSPQRSISRHWSLFACADGFEPVVGARRWRRFHATASTDIWRSASSTRCWRHAHCHAHSHYFSMRTAQMPPAYFRRLAHIGRQASRFSNGLHILSFRVGSHSAAEYFYHRRQQQSRHPSVDIAFSGTRRRHRPCLIVSARRSFTMMALATPSISWPPAWPHAMLRRSSRNYSSPLYSKIYILAIALGDS